MDKVKDKLLLVTAGLVTGVANGFFGGGGGMVVVPFLVYLLKYEAKVAHATAILIILPITLFSALIYSFSGNLSLNETFLTSVGVFIGGLVGAYFLPKLSNKFVMFLFAGVMIAAGVKLTFF